MTTNKEHTTISTGTVAKQTRIRPYRHADGDHVRKLFGTSIVSTSVGSPLRASLWIQLKDNKSILIYVTWIVSIFLQLNTIAVLDGYDGRGPSFVTYVNISRGLFVAATAAFLYRTYELHAAFMKFIHRAATTDLFDVAESYGMVATERTEKTGELSPVGPNGFWVAEMYDENEGEWEIVGCTGIDISTYPDPDAAELRRMAVSSKCRRQGIAGRLINTALDHARSHNIKTVYLTTCTYNPSAVGLYLRFGWVIIDEFTLLKKIRASQFKLDLH